MKKKNLLAKGLDLLDLLGEELAEALLEGLEQARKEKISI